MSKITPPEFEELPGIKLTEFTCNPHEVNSNLYISSKNFSHSAYEKSEAKMQILTSNSYENVIDSLTTISPTNGPFPIEPFPN